ncbi:uncharacterized protein [Temnothorax nylanderi]|uniref:uncharacterized protein n=1 Tax=Temnothorax nylanderi TaxID=102681 RepID=UPI003A8B1888
MEYDNSNSSESSSPGTRYELLETISMLKTYISLLESTIETPEVEQSQVTKESSKLLYSGEGAAVSRDKPDVQTELCRNIYQFAKVQCINFKRDSRFIFEIPNSENIVKSDLYTIEILVDDKGRGKLGKCVLPDFINVNSILWQYPIDNLNNVKHFLKSCKRNIDCYFCRLQQINELKILLSKIRNGCVCHNNDVTLIELTMHNVKDVYTYDIHDVIMYLHYHFDEARPYKLYASTNDVGVRSPTFQRRLNMYFVPFLKKDLSPAFMQVINSCVEFIWQKVLVDNEDNVEVYECEERICENEEDGGYVDQFLYRRDRRLRTTNEGEMQFEITLDKDEAEIDTSR